MNPKRLFPLCVSPPLCGLCVRFPLGRSASASVFPPPEASIGQGAARLPTVPTLPDAAAPAGDAPPRPALRILLVDDHQDTNRSLVLLLRRRGYEAEAATTLAAARRLVENAPPFDLLITDMGLPDGNGLDLLPSLHPPPRLGGIVLSGLPTSDHLERSRANGYRLHLCKPVDFQRIDRAIKELLQSGESESA